MKKAETTVGIEFEAMKEHFSTQARCPTRTCGASRLRVEGNDRGQRHVRCRECGCEWLERLN